MFKYLQRQWNHLCGLCAPAPTIGFFASSFDPFPHPGTLSLLQYALDRGYCDKFILALHVDPSIERPEKPKPYMTTMERQIMLWHIRDVVEVVTYNTEAELHKLLVTMRPDIRLLTDKYIDRPYTGEELPIRVVYIPVDRNFERDDYVRRIKNDEFRSVAK